MRHKVDHLFITVLSTFTLIATVCIILFFYNLSLHLIYEPSIHHAREAAIIFGFLMLLGAAIFIVCISFFAKLFLKSEVHDYIKLKHRFESMNESIGEGVLALDTDGSIVFANSTAARLLGYTKEEMLGKNAHELIHYETKDGRYVPKEECHVLQRLEKDGSCSSDDDVYIRKDGVKIDVSFVATPLLLSGKNEGSMIVFSDITEKRHNLKKLLLSDVIVKNIKEGVLVADKSTNIVFINPYFEHITGYLAADVIGKKPSILKSNMHDERFYRDMWIRIDMNGYWQGEIWNRRKDGKLYAEWLSIISVIPEHSKDEKFFVGVFSDITERKLLEEELSRERELLRHQAAYDKLTEIYNRQKFEDALAVEFDRNARYRTDFSLIMLDIDNFKSINDTYGHQIGDYVLKEIAFTLKGSVRKMDTVCRWGGEEFLILAPQTDIKGAASIAENLREIIENKIFGEAGRVTCSFGVTALESTDDKDSLLSRVDEAMYVSKKEGKNRVTLL
ncbi:MAG: diguanylate cyclase [Campylobacterales bacterium]